MFRDNRRVTFRQRRLIRHLGRSKHASVQDAALHEVHRSMRRSHGLKPPKPPSISSPGTWRPLTRKAKALLSRLRGARQWNVKKNIMTELARELEHGRRIAQRLQEAAQRARAKAQAVAARVRAGAGRAGRTARAAARRTRNGWNRARPHAARAGRKFRSTVSRGQERQLARAERKQAGPEKPGLRVRRHGRPRPLGPQGQRFGAARVRATWKQWRWERATPRDHGWERSRYNAQSPRYRPLAERRRNAGRGPRPVPARRRAPRPPRPARTR